MNRITALFFATALLLAHALAIHHTKDGVFGPPYELAHVAFRVARNLVHAGTLAWNPGMPVAESYPSPLWIAMLAVAERLYIAPNHFTMFIGLVSALAVVVVVAGFSRERIAGVIAPMFVVVSGGVAAAATDGTETAFFTLLVCLAFLGFERRWRLVTSLSLALACLTQPAGMWFTIALLGLELVGRRRARLRGDERVGLAPAFVLPALTILGAAAIRLVLTGSALSPTSAAVLSADLATVELGWSYLVEYAWLYGTPLLIVVPLVVAALGELKGTGRRALLLTLFWVVWILLAGGDGEPFGRLLVPALPILYIAVQEALTVALDTRHRALAAGAWVLFSFGLASSAFASKLPGDIGPLLIGDRLRARFQPGPTMAAAWDGPLGRLGVQAELSQTMRLRRLSLFVRDRLPHGVTILTPWPGALGYLSRKQVYDVLGRATLAPGAEIPNPWFGRSRVDLIRVLEAEHDYIVPSIDVRIGPPTLDELIAEWCAAYDAHQHAPGRTAQFHEALAPYELISVPLPDSEDPDSHENTPAFLLRRRDLDLGPTIHFVPDDAGIGVQASHRGHQQLADLMVWTTDASGARRWLRPTGQWSDLPTMTRTGLLLYPAGDRRVQLLDFPIPSTTAGTTPREIHAVLLNPGAPVDTAFAEVSPPIRLRL